MSAGWVCLFILFSVLFFFFLLYLPEWMAITELLGSHFVFVVVVVVALFFSSFAPGLGGCLAFPGLPYWIERERESGDSNKDWCWDGGTLFVFLSPFPRAIGSEWPTILQDPGAVFIHTRSELHSFHRSAPRSICFQPFFDEAIIY